MSDCRWAPRGPGPAGRRYRGMQSGKPIGQWRSNWCFFFWLDKQLVRRIRAGSIVAKADRSCCRSRCGDALGESALRERRYTPPGLPRRWMDSTEPLPRDALETLLGVGDRGGRNLDVHAGRLAPPARR